MGDGNDGEKQLLLRDDVRTNYTTDSTVVTIEGTGT